MRGPSFRPSARFDEGGRVALGALVLGFLLFGPAGFASIGPSHAVPAAPVLSLAPAFTPSSGAILAGPGVVAPQVTAAFDWDPQPFILPPKFPISDVAGEGAVMATSDLYGTVVLFGGEGPFGLTNLTITVNESSALWTIAPLPPGPSPRANSSFVLADGGREAVLFGGVVNLTTDATDNQTWIYQFQSRTWQNVTGSIAPPPRESAAMASDPRGQQVVLEGGWNPDYSVGGAGASVTWNDTWVLNLTTFNWTREGPSNAPRPMFGSTMIYAPPVSSYLLFGGCSSKCSNALYAYTIGRNWTPIAELGDIPAPEGGSTAVWSPNWNLTFLTGGFEFGANTLVPLNDSYIYTPTTHTWDLIASPAPWPSPRFDSAASFLDANQCPGLFIVGGSPSLTVQPPDGWFMDSNPDYGSGCNNWGGDEVGGNGGGPANCTPTATLNVSVSDSATHLPIPGAAVQVSGACGTLAFTTNAQGWVNFTALPNETARVEASAADYHTNTTFENLSVAGFHNLTMALDPLPVVDIQVVGVSFPAVTASIFNASVFLAPSLALGFTDQNGWFNLSGFSGPQGPNTFLATAIGYSNGSARVEIPYSGVVPVKITLLSYGAFDVHILEYPDGTPIAGADGLISPVGAYTFGGAVRYVTTSSGWFNTTLPQENFSVTATASGFVSNDTRLPVFHTWVLPSVVTINLTLLRGADLAVRLVDAKTHQPLGIGAVRLGYFPYENTSASGWANYTNVLPPGWYQVEGSAPNYAPNATAVDLTYLAVNDRVYLNLTHLPTCQTGCYETINGTTGAFHLLPSSGSALDAFLLAPALLVLAGAIYALYVRRRAEAPS